ncbi:MAG: amidase [Methylibium sp. NZG]|nr:MAG: amidase [Methylibium sp. NZG]
MIHDPAHAFVPYPPAHVVSADTGPLSGLHFAVKDLFDVAGYPTGGGSPLVLAMSGIKTRTAPTVQRLLDAGARFVGKTVTDELAFSMNGQNAHFGSPINGAAPERISGGSSSGSASAVSNRLCDFALGTDTGGSVRAPASHCGLVGLRPTHGRVSLQGAMDLSPSFDTCGWFARDVATFARVADVLLGADTAALRWADRHAVRDTVKQVASQAPTHDAANAATGTSRASPTAGAPLRLLWPTDLWTQLAPAAEPTARAAAERVQALLGPATPVDVVLDSFDAMYWNFRYLQGCEAWRTHGAMIERHAPPLGPGVAERFAFGRAVTDAQVADATAFRARFTAHLDATLGADGVLLLPTMPDIAPLTSATDSALEDYRNRAIRLLCAAGLAGTPQLSLPLAGRDGAPMGLSLLGPRGSDRSLVALAEHLARSGMAGLG